MPRSKQDNLYFADFEKLVFGTEPGNQSSIYHDGANIVFENITISGAQGPEGPPGAGIPGNVIQTEAGYTSVTTTEQNTIEFKQANLNSLTLMDGSVVAGHMPSQYHNWGNLIVKSDATVDNVNEGLKLAFFGPTGQQTLDFLRSPTNSTAAGPSITNSTMGAIQWNSLDYDRESITPYARIRSVDTYSVPTTDTHLMNIIFETVDTNGDWQRNLTLDPGADPFIKLNKGRGVCGIAESFDEISELGLTNETSLLTAYGVLNEIVTFKNEIEFNLATFSGALSWKIHDTLDLASVECVNSSIDFKINDEKISWFDGAGFNLGNSTPVVAILSDAELDDSAYTLLGHTLATTSAIKQFVLNNALSGEGSARLLAGTGDVLQLGSNSLNTTFNNNMFFDIKRIINGGHHMIFGDKTFDNLFHFEAGRGTLGDYADWIGRKGDFSPEDIITEWISYDPDDPWANLGTLPKQYVYESPGWLWNLRQWSDRIYVNNKHTVTITDASGPSLSLLAWGSTTDVNNAVWRKGPQIAFNKLGGTPTNPTHTIGGDILGKITWNYYAFDGKTQAVVTGGGKSGQMDRAAWIDCRLSPEYYDGESIWQMAGGLTIPRADFRKIESEITIGASTYIHYGRIKLRSKLMFDDGSENFVSGIIQAEDTPCIPVNSIENITDTQDQANWPWDKATAQRRIWGLDHALPTAAWVTQEATRVVNGILNPDYTGDDANGYNLIEQHYAVGAAGMGFIGGPAETKAFFGYTGSPNDPINGINNASTWALRLRSATSYGSRFFIENFWHTNLEAGQPAMGSVNFFRSRGGKSFNTPLTWNSWMESFNTLSNNNGALQINDYIGAVTAWGQAAGSGLDRDPCVYWAAYKPAARMFFRADEVTQERVKASIVFETGRDGTYTNSKLAVAVFDHLGKVHFGEHVRGGGVSNETAISGDAATTPGNEIGILQLNRRKGWVNITGGEHPYRIVPTGAIGTLSLWSTYPSIVFSVNASSQIQENHIDGRIGFYAAGSYYNGTNLGGMYFTMWNSTTLKEEHAAVITTNRKLVVGNRFNINDNLGTLIVAPSSNGIATGLVVVSSLTQNKRTKIFMTDAGEGTINVDNQPDTNRSDGSANLYLNDSEGKVFIGRVGKAKPVDNDKVIVNGNVIPAQDNLFNLGKSTNRWDDIWATNGTIQVSDARDKHEIKKEGLGIAFINKLNPVAFKRVNGVRNHHGLIAQEVEDVFKSLGKDDNYFAGLIHDKESDKYGLRYEEFIAPMIKAIQELSAEVTSLKQQLENK